MTSIIKVDQIQTLAGAAPTAADLGINVTGSVLQVKHHTISPGTQAISSTSLVETGLTITITPRNANSSFFIIASMSECYVPGSAQAIGFALAKNGIRLSHTDNATVGYTGSGGVNYFNYNLHSYDSPATTSAITYSMMVRSIYGNAVYVNADGTPTFLTVMEISG
tara:strand:+ start:933 stop:1430 length:498 start_codon:yes stop_codon:yes gene_type:complete